MSNENNKMQVDIDNLFKQNVNDLTSIKELYRKFKEVEEKITQIKYIDSNLANKLKKDYENLKKDYESLKKAISEDYESLKCVISEDYESLKCIVLDENIQAKLNNDIETINVKLTNYNMDTKSNKNSINFKGCFLEKTLEKLYKEQDTTIMFAGDSVTRGYNSSSRDKCYVGLFAQYLADNFPNTTVIRVDGEDSLFNPIKKWNEKIIQTGTKNTVRVVNAGSAGDDIYAMINRINNFTSYNDLTPDCIITCVGINDSFPSRADNEKRNKPPRVFKELLISFLDNLYERTGAELALGASHWIKDSPESYLTDYVKVIREVANEKNILLFDYNAKWVNHYSNKVDKHGHGDWMIQNDNIHPTDVGHREGLFNVIIENLFKTKKSNKNIVTKIELDSTKQNFVGTWENINITDSLGDASYSYKRFSTNGHGVKLTLTGNEIYAIVRNGRDSCTIKNYSKNNVYPSYNIKIGNEVFPDTLQWIKTEEMYSAHNKRVLLYKGGLKTIELELTCVSGNMDLNGFETVIYPYSFNIYDVNELNIYIDNLNGNDENDGLTQDKSLKTIEKALEIIKNNSKIEIATLNIVSYESSDIVINNINTKLIIKSVDDTVKSVGKIQIKNSKNVELYNLKPISTSNHSLECICVGFIKTDNLDITDSTCASMYGMRFAETSAYCSNISLDNRSIMLLSERNSRIAISFKTLGTSYSAKQFLVNTGSSISIMSNTSVNKGDCTIETGGYITNNTGDKI